jgi:hypothetical protein
VAVCGRDEVRVRVAAAPSHPRRGGRLSECFSMCCSFCSPTSPRLLPSTGFTRSRAHPTLLPPLPPHPLPAPLSMAGRREGARRAVEGGGALGVFGAIGAGSGKWRRADGLFAHAAGVQGEGWQACVGGCWRCGSRGLPAACRQPAAGPRRLLRALAPCLTRLQGAGASSLAAARLPRARHSSCVPDERRAVRWAGGRRRAGGGDKRGSRAVEPGGLRASRALCHYNRPAPCNWRAQGL